MAGRRWLWSRPRNGGAKPGARAPWRISLPLLHYGIQGSRLNGHEARHARSTFEPRLADRHEHYFRMGQASTRCRGCALARRGGRGSRLLSVISLAEIRFEVERLPPGRRRTRLNHWLREELPTRFEGRIVPVDEEVAEACGRLLAQARRSGRGLEATDALIAATCEVRDLVLATRNLADFQDLGIELHAL